MSSQLGRMILDATSSSPDQMTVTPQDESDGNEPEELLDEISTRLRTNHGCQRPGDFDLVV